MTIEDEDYPGQGHHPNPKDLWRNRRKMAWLSLLSLLTLGVGVLFKDISAPQADILSTVAFSLAGIVGAYVGFAAMQDTFSRDGRGGRR